MTTPQVLGERYEIGGVLGRGGMAEVHRGRDLRLGREVAVKVLRMDLARDPSFQVRFRREAQASASLNHPAIVAVYDTGEDRTANGATPYIVMEYVEGETLRDVLRAEGLLSPERAMSLTADICAALDFSHRNGIVHRDVKPGNVMITPQGTVKVMDFGIARAVSDSAATMTSTAAVIGTAQYLSPEQARGEGVDARSDVYSAGCLLYELVTGAPPFTGDSPVAVAYQHVREDPKMPSSINPEIPPELDAILLKAMSKNPANRYQSAAEMRSDLLRAVAGQRVEATPVMGEAERTSMIATTGYGDAAWDDEDEVAATRRRRGIMALVAALVVVLIGVVTLVVVLNNRAEPPPAVVTVAVPSTLVNATPDAAAAALTEAGLALGTQATAASTPEQAGLVISTDPAAGAQVARGTEVDLLVGAGPDTIAVPTDLEGLTLPQATALLTAQGFTTRPSTTQTDSLQQEGTVVAVDPPAGSAIAPTASISLGISTGTVPLPDVRGQEESSAVDALVDAGFSADDVVRMNVERDDVPPGTVVGSDPAPNAPVGAGDEITLMVAVPTPTTAPTTTSAPPSSSPAPATTSPTTTPTSTSEEPDPPAAPPVAPGTGG